MNPKVKRLLATGVSVGMIALAASGPTIVAAQDDANSLFPRNEFGRLTNIDAFIRGIIRVVFIVSTLAVLLYLIFGGFRWVASGGDKAKTEEARNTITAAIIGLAIVALSFIIVTMLEAFFGFSITKGGIEQQIRNAVR